MNRFHVLKHMKEWLLDRPLKTGTLLNSKYRILQVLGMGSYGISYLCKTAVTRHLCVVKQVKPSKRKGLKGMSIYQNEMYILHTLRHPNIPQFMESFKAKGHYFFVMQYVEGRNLEDLIFEDGTLFTEQQTLHWMLQLLSIIQYIHGQQIVHRDIRPPNLIINGEQIYLIDFGLAASLHEIKRDSVYNRLDKYPIEKYLKSKIDVKSDFYSMGQTMLFMLYSTFEPTEQPESLSWEEELSIHPLTKTMIRRLLMIDEPYQNIDEIEHDLREALESIREVLK